MQGAQDILIWVADNKYCFNTVLLWISKIFAILPSLQIHNNWKAFSFVNFPQSLDTIQDHAISASVIVILCS